MMEIRKFHRVKFSTRIILSQHGILHHGRLENISKCGALVRLELGTHLLKECAYELCVYLDGEELPLQFRTELVNISFGMAGIKFVSYDSETETRLNDLLALLSSEVDSSKSEHAKSLKRLAVNFHEG